ncbi:hypothetical protein NM208_g16918 [Fusarium decemcellulare]|uniref:Uncharacterized protein n=1 Tax=Fusarium decemcellulare TaxID=57161 RepID=A0ACC1R8X8_9HYPO|nr:hypothetical protein NM208_g16918 [Fusarium decemcellulare]
MAAISECVERQLEALEEGCDPGSGSHPSSGAARSGTQPRPSAGQKRSNRHGIRDESENDDDDESSRKKDSKRAKTTKDDTRPRYACPYHQFNPERFGKVRTCCGPGWTELSRVKEHLERKHCLPRFQCNRCYCRFKEEEELKKHQRQSTPCPVKEVSNYRDLSEGYDEEQWKRLKVRSKKAPSEKWKEWYCILFNLKSDSPDIPSPFYDPSLSRNTPATKTFENAQECRDWFTRAEPLIRQQVTLEVEKALDDYEPRLKRDVLERLQDLPDRIAELIPMPGRTAEETSNMTEGTAVFNFLEDLDVDAYGGGPFDFNTLNEPDQLGMPDTFILSESSDYSNPNHSGESSATSVEDDTAYQSFNSKAGLIPASLDLSYASNNFY